MFEKIKEIDRKIDAKILNYPSKGIYIFLLFIILISGWLYIPILVYLNISFNNSINIYSVIFIQIIVIFVLILYVWGFNFIIVDSIKFYEEKYGKTGRGNKYLMKQKENK